MLQAHPADVAIEIDVIRSFSTLERARPAADPRESPTALILCDDEPAASRLLSALGRVSLARPEGASLSCAWVPRAVLLRALERVEPLRCVDDGEHEWDEREITGEDGAAVDDTTCTRCGLPDDLYATCSAWGFGE